MENNSTPPGAAEKSLNPALAQACLVRLLTVLA